MCVCRFVITGATLLYVLDFPTCIVQAGKEACAGGRSVSTYSSPWPRALVAKKTLCCSTRIEQSGGMRRLLTRLLSHHAPLHGRPSRKVTAQRPRWGGQRISRVYVGTVSGYTRRGSAPCDPTGSLRMYLRVVRAPQIPPVADHAPVDHWRPVDDDADPAHPRTPSLTLTAASRGGGPSPRRPPRPGGGRTHTARQPWKSQGRGRAVEGGGLARPGCALRGVGRPLDGEPRPRATQCVWAHTAGSGVNGVPPQPPVHRLHRRCAGGVDPSFSSRFVSCGGERGGQQIPHC